MFGLPRCRKYQNNDHHSSIAVQRWFALCNSRRHFQYHPTRSGAFLQAAFRRTRLLERMGGGQEGGGKCYDSDIRDMHRSVCFRWMQLVNTRCHSYVRDQHQHVCFQSMQLVNKCCHSCVGDFHRAGGFSGLHLVGKRRDSCVRHYTRWPRLEQGLARFLPRCIRGLHLVGCADGTTDRH